MAIRTPARTFIRIAAFAAALGAVAAAASSSPPRSRRLPLAAPVLDAFNGKWHHPSYSLSGSVDSVRVGSQVRIFRNGSVVDSASTSASRTFTVAVALVPGLNEFTAVLHDADFNASPISNTVTVHFETVAGLFIPTPFAPGAAFNLNAVDGAIKAELRVYDTMGDEVVRFENREPRTYYAFTWNGKNGSGHSVWRGPLVAVGSLFYADGTHDVIRRVFLYDPEASP